jgi:hypothetical protein
MITKKLSLLFATIVFGAVPAANAVTISNVTTATTVFRDNFESGTFSPSVGLWSVGSSVTVQSSTPPGAREGSFYAQLFRDSNTPSQGNLDAILGTAQTNPGDHLRLDMMVYVPSSSDVNVRGQFILSDGDFNSARAWMRPDGAGNVIAVGPAFALIDTGLNYNTDVWQQWSFDYVIGAPTFDVSIDGLQATGLPSFTIGGVSRANLFNGSSTPGAFFIDAVPEPSTTLLVTAGVLFFGARHWRRKPKS